MTDDFDAERRVAVGAERLDAVVPGWERRVDLGALNMDRTHPEDGCIACQSTGMHYSQAIRKLRVGDGRSPRYGFAALNLPAGGAMKREYAALDAAWRAIVKGRFETGLLSDGDGS